jgi:uncharacterized BrkB/YihY/UPF0761 family membrane protein
LHVPSSHSGLLVMVVVGWTKWYEKPRHSGISPDYSFIGMFLSSATVLGLFVFGIYAVIFDVRFSAHYDLLVGIYKFLALLCLFGVLFGFVGVWRRSPLCWYAPACAFFTACLWLVGAVMIDPI